MPSTVVRAALVVLTVLVAIWLVLGFRAVELRDDGAAVLERARVGRVVPDELQRGRRALQDARRFSPDLGPLVEEGYLLDAAGQRQDAAAIAKRATAEEPQNVEAWLLAYLAYPDRQRPATRRRIAELDPLVAVEPR